MRRQSLPIIIIIMAMTLLLTSSQQLEQTKDDIDIEKMFKKYSERPSYKITKPTFKFKPTQKAYFAFNLYNHPEEIQRLKAEEYYYRTKYGMDDRHNMQEQPICVVSVGRNLVFQLRYMSFLDSIHRQKYKNYHVVILDDFSDDDTVAKMEEYLMKKFNDSSWREKIQIVRSQRRNYALYNRNLGVRKYCRKNQIVIQMDSDDCFIGTQAFRFINYVYQDPNVWVFYSNYVRWNAENGEPSQGISSKISTKILLENKYRHSGQWITSATRTYRRQLFLKINQQDFKDAENNKNTNNNSFYQWTSDLFIHYSLIELAGEKHYKFINEIFYYYHLTHNPFESLEKKRCRFRSYHIQPYLPLGSLSDQPERDPNKKNPPEWMSKQLQSIEEQISSSFIKKL